METLQEVAMCRWLPISLTSSRAGASPPRLKPGAPAPSCGLVGELLEKLQGVDPAMEVVFFSEILEEYTYPVELASVQEVMKYHPDDAYEEAGIEDIDDIPLIEVFLLGSKD